MCLSGTEPAPSIVITDDGSALIRLFIQFDAVWEDAFNVVETPDVEDAAEVGIWHRLHRRHLHMLHMRFANEPPELEPEEHDGLQSSCEDVQFFGAPCTATSAATRSTSRKQGISLHDFLTPFAVCATLMI